jgi:tRNA-Thr(GGU) m(6)t(6)A37 methyltransferase TsaA
MRFNIKVIGRVENGFVKRERIHAENVISRIVVDPAYSSALDGIEPFSHIMVIFWLDQVQAKERKVLKVHPRGNPSLPLTGVFATRSPLRPNPIAVSEVQLIKRKGNVLIVKGLDALNGTPVLDIKPYLPEPIANSDIKVPGWVKEKS